MNETQPRIASISPVKQVGALLGVALAVALGVHRSRRDDVDVAGSSLLARAFAASAVHERILFAYLVGLLLMVLNGNGPRGALATALLVGDVILFVCGLVYVRAAPNAHPFGTALAARLLVLGGILGSFFQLHVILPAARGGTWDAQLHHLDLALFGFEPATAWDRWVTPNTTEWFSFFYFGYFVLLAVHVIPVIVLERRTQLVGEFALGMVAVYCIGQFIYLVVPGFGPYRTLAFSNELSGPFWWKLVQSGAAAIDETSRTDIFPSLHTGGPAFLTLFSFRHRARAPFRYTWPVLAFFTSQIILATMFLRWHYLIDVIAGVLLAALAVRIAARFPAEERTRAMRGLAPAWTTLTLRATEPSRWT
jgi:hypothetical protein